MVCPGKRIGPSSRERRRRDHPREIAGQVCIEAVGAAFRITDASVSDKRAWVSKSGSLRAYPPFLTSHGKNDPWDTDLDFRGPRDFGSLTGFSRRASLGGRTRAIGIRRLRAAVRRAGPEFLLLGSQAAAIEGAQLPAERPQARPGSRPSHGRGKRPSPSILQVRIDHGGDSAARCVRPEQPPWVRRSRACINRPARRYTRPRREVNERTQENTGRGRHRAGATRLRRQGLLDAGVRQICTALRTPQSLPRCGPWRPASCRSARALRWTTASTEAA